MVPDQRGNDSERKGKSGERGFRGLVPDQGKTIARGEARVGNGGSGVRSATEGIEGADVPGLDINQREAIAGERQERRTGVWGFGSRPRGRQ